MSEAGHGDGRHPSRILVYKRTHIGDPDEHGRFGVDDCMRSVRGWNFDGVIGIGGVSPSDRAIARKINWVGRFPRRDPNPFCPTPFPLLKFASEDVKVMEDLGPLLETSYKAFANEFFGSGCRFWVLAADDSRKSRYREACEIIASVLADAEQPVVGRSFKVRRGAGGATCGPRGCGRC